jgi:ribosome-associated protein
LGRESQYARSASVKQRVRWRNRELATERVVEELRRALRVERRRVPTKPTKAATERRLEQKRRRGELKRLRRAP